MISKWIYFCLDFILHKNKNGTLSLSLLVESIPKPSSSHPILSTSGETLPKLSLCGFLLSLSFAFNLSFWKKIFVLWFYADSARGRLVNLYGFINVSIGQVGNMSLSNQILLPPTYQIDKDFAFMSRVGKRVSISCLRVYFSVVCIHLFCDIRKSSSTFAGRFQTLDFRRRFRMMAIAKCNIYFMGPTTNRY